MPDYATLAKRRGEITAEIDALQAQDEWSDADRSTFDRLSAEHERVVADLDRLAMRAEADRQATRHDRPAPAAAPPPPRTDERVSLDSQFTGDTPTGPTDFVGNLAALPRLADQRTGYDPRKIIYRGPETWHEPTRIAGAFGEFLADVRAAAGPNPVVSDRLMQLQAASGDPGNTRIGSEGGFLIQQDAGGMILDGMMSRSPFLDRSMMVPLSPGSNGIRFYAVDEISRETGSRWGGVRAYWTEEQDQPTRSRFPKLREIELRLHKIMTLAKVTDELLQDTSAAGMLLLRSLSDEMTFVVDDSLFRGDGIGKPLGFTSAKNKSLVVATKVASQAADSIEYRNLSQMWMHLHTRSKAMSTWFYNNEANPWFDRLHTPGTTSDFNPRFVSYGMNGLMSIKGRPAVETEYNAGIGDQGDLVLADMSQYLVITGAMQQATSIHVAFETDETMYRITWRIDGKPAWVNSCTPYKGAAKTSPFVVLAARA